MATMFTCISEVPLHCNIVNVKHLLIRLEWCCFIRLILWVLFLNKRPTNLIGKYMCRSYVYIYIYMCIGIHTLREERRLSVSENRVLRRIYSGLRGTR